MPGPDTEPRLVSVIMPCYNVRPEFLAEAIASVQAQTYEHWELIIVDDGSEIPVTTHISNMAGNNVERIRCVSHTTHENLGISASRNLGLSVATGEFVAFLDGDDVWDETQLAEQVEILDQQPATAMVYGNTIYWYSWERCETRAAEDFVYDLKFRTPALSQPPSLLLMMLTRRTVSPCMTSLLVRSQVFAEGITFVKAFPVHFEDQVFMAQVFASYPVFVSDRVWGKYRQHTESVTEGGRDLAGARKWRIAYLRWLAEYLSSHNMKMATAQRAIRLELFASRNRYTNRIVSIVHKTIWRCKRRYKQAASFVATLLGRPARS